MLMERMLMAQSIYAGSIDNCTVLLGDFDDQPDLFTLHMGTMMSNGIEHYILADIHSGSQNMALIQIDIPDGVTVTRIVATWSGGGAPRYTLMHNSYNWTGSNHITTQYPGATNDQTGLSLSGGYVGIQLNGDFPAMPTLDKLTFYYNVDEGYANPWSVNCIPETPLVIKSYFTGSNGTNIHGYTPALGGAISVTTGTMEINSNRALVTSSTADAMFDTFYGAGEIEFTFIIGAAIDEFAPSIIFRGSTTDRYMIVYFSGDGLLQIYRRTVSTFTAVATGSWSANTSPHQGKVVFYENDVEVFLDGSSALTYTMDEDNDHFGTLVGFRGFKFGSDADKFDNFTFKVPAEMVWQNWPGDLVSTPFTDDFGDANGTSLLTTGYSNQFGSWTTQSGKGVNGTSAGATSGYTVVYDAGQPDHGVEVAASTPSSGYFIPGVSGRWVDANHFIEFEVNNRPSYVGHQGAGVWFYDGTVFHPIVTHSLTPAVSTTYTMRLWFKGEYVFAEIVGAGIKMAAKCSQYTSATRAGLFEANDAVSGISGGVYDSLSIVVG